MLKTIGKAFDGLSQQSLKNYQEESQMTTYFLGLENLDNNTNLEKIDQKCIVETTHVSITNMKASLILPQISVFEKSGYFINYSGLYQKATRIARFGQRPLSNLKKLATLKKSNAKSKLVLYYFNSFVSKSLRLLESFSINLKFYRTQLKMLDDDPYYFDRCTRASLSLNKVSGNFCKNFSNFFKRFVSTKPTQVKNKTCHNLIARHLLFNYYGCFFLFIFSLYLTTLGRFNENETKNYKVFEKSKFRF